MESLFLPCYNHSMPTSPRNTKQRAVILDIFAQAKKPLPAPVVVSKAQAKVPKINKTTIYRTLERLEKEGMVSSMLVSPGVLHYELAKGDAHHHHHFVCNRCEGVFCLEGCTQGLSKLLPKGFILDSHDITLHGTCADCAKASKGS